MLVTYPLFIEREMQLFYRHLPERERRRYAAIEAKKLPHGGRKYIQDLLGVHSSTLKRAIDELTHPELFSPLPLDKQRRTGGGRKKNGSLPR
jgi:hypothetical protein